MPLESESCCLFYNIQQLPSYEWQDSKFGISFNCNVGHIITVVVQGSLTSNSRVAPHGENGLKLFAN